MTKRGMSMSVVNSNPLSPKCSGMLRREHWFHRNSELARLRFLDLYRIQLVALLNRIDDVLTGADLAEHRVLAVEPVGFHVRDEELAAVRIRPGVGHGQRPGLMLVRIAL